MSNTMDFFEISNTRQEIERDLKERVSVIEAGLGDIKSLPNDLFNDIPLVLLPNDQAKYEAIESKHTHLTCDYMAKYFLSLVDANNSLVLLSKLQEVSLSQFINMGERNLILAVKNDIGETDNLSYRVHLMAERVSAFVAEHNIYVPEEPSKITKFCLENEDLISPDMDEEILYNLYGEVYAHTCESLNDLADLCVESLDVDIGYLHYQNDLTQEDVEAKADIIKNTLIKSEDFLLMSRKYLDFIQLGYGHNNSPDDPASHIDFH